MFRGSFVALVTPMFDSGDVDYASLATLVEFHIQNNTHGIVAVGTTGESATLPFEEHIKVIQFIVECATGKIPVIAGSGANATNEAVFLTKQIEKVGVDGFLSVVPYYNKPQQAGLVAHFKAVASASDLPLILYNVPSRTVLDMHTSTVAILASHANIVGIKDATGDLSRLAQLQAAVPSDFLLFSGDDATGCEFLNNGGHGVISVTANIVPKQMSAMCEYALSKKYAQASAIDATLQQLHHALFLEPNPVLPKWALYKMNKMSSPFLRLPMILPELNHQLSIEQELKELGLI
ncbi:dihydrodipicolinate synthase [Glaciecola punicea ACAM 611]|jgi:4-hydroxy-tetrahydrodipicolinate synthase|uniref:4-hydroxy-tetrahydrodipicolinate synthase n=1 Tax=Glaciecola punicea ACAM 611 TaxID=1121923 RepID=H5T9T4_9ALTE|nr:4-hydroxy-tetrahydrodipicolinate synthase [Glaciecola punicea]OFA33360.1 4-hydroxy-tetrahydrodipicolinate synthase [Glaciecola punicea]GAB55061.1 dihydrodipicolinate synthase [Glaciecola punicea ACAM 611]